MTKYLLLLILVGLALLSCENNQKDGFTIKKIDPVNDYGNVDALIEISSGTLEKWEYNKSTGDIELELINNKPRIISYLGYPANYGMIPKTILPKEKITPITTTIIDEIAALNDLKKKYRINAVIIKANKINIEISFFTFIESTVLIYGNPE